MEPASNRRTAVSPDSCGSPSSADEEQLRLLLDALPESAYLCDPDGLITYYNDRAVEVWGRRPALNDPADRYCGSFGLRDSSGAPMRHEHCFMAVALRERQPQRGKEAIVERPDGTWRRVLAYATPWCDSNGRLIGGVNVLVDITDHKQMEAALNADQAALLRREAVLAQAGRMAHFGAWEVEIRDDSDISVNPLHWSDETFRIFGFSPGAVQPTSELFFSLVHPEDRQRIVEAVDRSKKERRPYEIEHRIRRCDGVERIVLEHAEWTFAPDGRPIRLVGAVQDITARKQADEALRRSEERHQALVKAVPDLMFLLDREGTYLDFHASDVGKLLVRPDEFLGKRVRDVMPAKLAAKIMEKIEWVAASGQTASFEYILPLPSGNRWFESRVTRCEPNLFLALARDITEQKQMVTALHESEERLRLVARATLDAYYDWDVRTNLVWRNGGYQQMLGADDPVGPDLDWIVDRMHPEDRDRVMASVQSAFQRRESTWQAEYRLVRRNGEVIHVLDRGHIEYDAQGQPLRLLGAFTDLTNRVRAAEKLRQSEQRHQALVNAVPDLMFLLDRDGVHLDFQAPDPESLFLSPDMFLGRRVADVLPGDVAGTLMEAIGAVAATGEASSVEYVLPFPGGARWFEARITPCGPDRFMMLTRNVTERVRVEETQQKLEARLMQAQKMEAVGQLAGGVAHDFNNLLTIIAGYVDLLQSSLPADSPLQSSVQGIQDAGQRAAALTGQLLAFSRRAVLEPKVLDLNAVVLDTEKMLLRLLGADIRLTTHLEPCLASVQVDPGQWGQVLINLVVNARDAMPAGGRLTIETAHAAVDEEAARSRPGIQPGRYVMLAISDTGHGMTADVRSHIFEPFFTTKEVGKGTGLGLAVVHGIVSQSGGFIDVVSEPNVGSTFEIYLPAVDLDPAASECESGTAGSPRGSETILLVEDEQAVLRIAQLALNAHGYHVLTATDGEAAFRIALESRGRIDLLLTDVVMPHLHGPELVNRLQPHAPNLKTLYTSGYTDDVVLRYGVSRESVAFLPKPYTPLALVRKVRQVLDQK